MIAWIKRRLGFKGASAKTVSVFRLEGPIGQNARFSKALNIEGLYEPLEKAFKPKKFTAVMLVINSPGGSPVQSSMIAKRIRQLSIQYDKPVFAVVEDVAASGGYWIACAAEEIFADPASVVGSIGVISAGFGFDELIQRYGIGRRVYTAGKNKMRLDPFQAEKAEDKEWLLALQTKMHAVFKEHVAESRGTRLQKSEDELMTGEVWLGKEALELGLIDGMGDATEIAREKFGSDVILELVSRKKGGLLSKLGLGDANSTLPEQALEALEQRWLWSRLGL